MAIAIATATGNKSYCYYQHHNTSNQYYYCYFGYYVLI